MVGIIGALGAVGTPMYQGYLTSTKENTAKDNLTTIAFMQSDHNREFGQYLPCPKKTLNTAQIDKEFFSGGGLISGGNGAHGDPLARDYEYELRGGCTNFMAYAFRTASVPDAKCFKVDSRRTISTITCPKAVTKVANCTLKSGTRISGGSTGKVVSCNSGKLTVKNIWKQTYEHKSLRINNPAGFDWLGQINGTTRGTHSRTIITQNGKKYFADELGITDYDLSSNSVAKCKYRYQKITNGTLKNNVKRWGYPAHKNNMYAGGKGLPYARDSLSNDRC